jgi:hypothetical protein
VLEAEDKEKSTAFLPASCKAKKKLWLDVHPMKI